MARIRPAPNRGAAAKPRPERLPEGARDRRIAVIDIGSNSIRLVVFEGLRRVPSPVFNEKVICGLGRGLNATGRLSEDGAAQAIRNLDRFTQLARAMGVWRLDLIATAAVREAENGADFIGQVEAVCGHPVSILSGQEEARISALGVLSGYPDADGIMGDLGGGSLELAALENGRLGESVTLRLGPLRLMDLAGGDLDRAKAEISARLAGVPWLARARGKVFYPVGGAWRSLARIDMRQTDYPLPVINGYSMRREQALELAQLLSRQSRRSLTRMPGITRRRLDAIPYAALVLERLLKQSRPERLIWSSFGLREGYLFDQLPAAEQGEDPLLAAVAEMALREGRFGRFAEAIAHWTAPLFADENEEQRRLREAACYLSDFAWRAHPNYRATHALQGILHFPFAGAEHATRAFLGLAVFIRYGGSPESSQAAVPMGLLGGKPCRRARLLGLAMRLAFTLSAGTREMLAKTEIRLDGATLTLSLPNDGSVPLGEAVERRFNPLIEVSGAESGEITVSGDALFQQSM